MKEPIVVERNEVSLNKAFIVFQTSKLWKIKDDIIALIWKIEECSFQSSNLFATYTLHKTLDYNNIL